MEQMYICLAIFVLMVVLFLTNKIPMAFSAMITMILLIVTGCIDYETALGTFGSTTVITMASMYIVAAGAFTSATYNTPQPLKRVMGAAAYAVEAILHNLDFQVFPLKIDCDGKTFESSAVLVFVLNGRSVAGWPINRSASMKDGKLEVVVIRQASRPNLFQKLTKYFSLATLFLFGCRVKKKDIVTLSGKHIKIETANDVVWDFDGEEGVKGSIEVTAERGDVRLFVPRGKKV